VGFRFDYEKAIVRPLPLRSRRARLLAGVTFLATSLGMAQQGTQAASDIKAGSNYLASGLGSSVNADFKGGTLQLDQSTTISRAFTVEDYSGNLIDEHGQTVTFSGAFTGSGPLTFGDSVGGGSVTLTSSGNAYTGSTTINSNGVVLLSGSGTLASSSGLDDEGVFDISQTTSGASLISLSGAGSVILGSKTLTVTDGAGGTFSGVISGTGGFTMNSGTVIFTGANTYTGGTIITGGTLELGSAGTSGSIVGNVADAGGLEFYRTDNVTFDGVISGTGTVSQIGTGTVTLTAANTYTGATSITTGTVVLSGNGSIAASSSVGVGGTLDISATSSGASVKSLTGAGTIQLGGQTLTITAASGTFTGVITGSGGVTMNGGTELLSGANTYTGATIVNGGTLQLGASTIAYNITDNATLGFNSASAIAMTGVVSGSGGLAQSGAGVTTISTVQTYTGATTISAGTLALSGPGSIATSSGVTDNSIFSVAASTSTPSITSLSGIGTVNLGSQTLILTSAQGSFSGTITGTGGLTLLAGGETLSGVNTYTGVTTISGGTLYVAGTSSLSASSKVVDNGGLDISSVGGSSGAATTSIISLSGSGSVTLGPKTLVLTGAADTFSGTISGSGGLTVNGGIETLTGVSSYTGTTTISAGTLALSGAGRLSSAGVVADSGVFDISAATGAVTLASLSGNGTVNLGAQTLNLANASTVFSGSISGTGALTISGGTQILSGANSYTGGTTIAAGTLQIGNSSSIGAIVGDVADSGTLSFDRSDTMVFSGVISGTGNVLQTGDGTTILTAANTYTGGTTITTGTLQIGDGGATGSITGDVTDYGTLAFGRTDATSFGGTISGVGGVTFVSGTTSFTTAQSYSGATLIDAGADFVLASGGSISNSSLVTDYGVLDLSSASGTTRITALAGSGSVILGGQSLALTGGSGTFSGTISGSGGLTVTGGSQVIAGTQAYTGATSVSGGKLTVNGSIASSSGVIVSSAGTLGGSGTVSSLSVNGGTVAPGVSGTGTLHVNGPVSFDSASTFVVTTSSAGVASLSATGTASLAGTLSVTSADGTYILGQKTAVLTASGGVSGSFTAAPIQSSGAQFSSKLSYDANDVYVEVDLAKLSPLLPATATVNQSAPIKGIDAAIAAGNSVPTGIQNLGNLTSATLAADSTQLDGELGGDMAKVGSSLLDPFFGAIANHISDGQQDGAISRRTPQAPRDQFWATGFDGADVTAADGGTGAHKFKSNVAGLAGGMDWHMAPNLTVGAAASAGFSNFHLADGLGQGKANAYQVAGYGLAQMSSRLYTSFAGGLALDDVSTTRTIAVSGTDVLKGKFTALTVAGRVETGLAMNWATSYIALQDDVSSLPGYQEAVVSGANTFALGYQSNTANHASVEIGLRQNNVVVAERGWSLHVTDKLAWEHDFSDQASANANFVSLPASKFTVYGAKAGSDAVLMSLGTELVGARGFGMNMHVDSQISAKSQTYTGMAGLNFAW
jgi:autotransporter-associated beta strand protein